MHLFTVFVSSAMSELAYEREIAAEVIRGLSAHAWLFELSPALSESPGKAYLDQVRDCDVFVLILRTQLRPAVLEEYHEALRGNKPVILLVRSTDSRERSKGLTAFLGEIRDRGTVVYKEYSTIAQFRERLHESITTELTGRFRPPRTALDRNDMYQMGIHMVRHALRQLAVVERTSSMLLLPPASKQPQAHSPQAQLVAAVDEWILRWTARASSDAPSPRFLYAFSLADTRQAFRSLPGRARKKVAENVTRRVARFKKLQARTGDNIALLPLREIFSGPMAVSDNRVALWILGDRDAVAIEHDNRTLANELFRMLRVRTSIDRALSATELSRLILE